MKKSWSHTSLLFAFIPVLVPSNSWALESGTLTSFHLSKDWCKQQGMPPLQVQSSIERNESILLCLHIPQTHTCTPACMHTAPVLSSSISGSSFLSRPSYPLTHLHGNSQTCIISPSAVLPCSLSCQFLFSWTLHCLSHRTPFLHPLTLRYIEPSFYIF